MSGICGVFSPEHRDLAGRDALATMLATLSHRGAVERTFYDEGAGIALGHLYAPAFVDPNEDTMPTWHVDEEFVVALAGQLHNGSELVPRERLHFYPSVACGAAIEVFRTAAAAFPARMDGHFQLALWDRREHTLRIATDPLSSMPLHFYWDAGKRIFLFASELKALLAHPAVRPDMDPEALAYFLAYSSVQPPLSIQKGASKLYPGEVVTISNGGHLTRAAYHRFAPAEKAAASLTEWGERTRAVMQARLAVTTHNTPRLAVLSSGGHDSASLLAALKDITASEVESFTVGYRDDKSRNDLYWGETAARESGVAQYRIEIGPLDTDLELLSRLMRQFDEPADSSRCLTQHYACEAMGAAGFNSCLTGGQGETTFGGLPSWGQVLKRRAVGQLPNDDAVINSMLLGGNFIPVPEQHKLIATPLMEPARVFERVLQGFMERVPRDNLFDFIHTTIGLRLVYGRTDIFNHVISPLSGVEVRPAYYDVGLINYARTIPNELRGGFDPGQSRAVLVAAYGERAPSLVLQRPKSGYPGAPWANPAYPHLERAVLGGVERLKQTGLVVPRRIDKMLAKYRSPGHHGSVGMKLWLLFALQVWFETYIENRVPLAEFA